MNNKRDSLLQVSERNNGPRSVMSRAVLETTFEMVTLSFCFSEPTEGSSFADSSTETRLNVPQGTILRRHTKGRFTHSMTCPCLVHAFPLPCLALRVLNVFPIWFTQCGRVWFTLAMPRPCHALTTPFFSMPRHGHGMVSVNQTRLHCVNQMGKTHSKPLAARHDRGTAWARLGHGMLCVKRPLMVDDGSYTKDCSDRNIRKPNKYSLQRQAGAYWSRRKKTVYIL